MALKTLLLDLDGTVYFGEAEVPGASAFIRHCNGRGIRSLFVTNRSNRPPVVVRDQLRAYGIPCETEDVLTSGQATARYLRSGSVYMIGEEGLELAFREQGIRVVTDPDERPDAVVVSYDRGITYEKIAAASRWIGEGVRFVATNTDKSLRVNGRRLPGTGTFVCAVQAASGDVEPEVVGKPERLIFDMALDIAGCAADEALAIGDNLRTDIGAANRAGIPSVLLMTGLHTAADIVPGGPTPTYCIADYAELTRLVDSLSAS